MDMGLQNKVAVITGGSEGIGFAAARAFIAEGAYAAVCGRRKDVLEQAVAKLGPRAFGVPSDMTKEEEVHDFARRVLTDSDASMCGSIM